MASAYYRAGVFSSVEAAAAAFNALIDPIVNELRRGGRPDTSCDEVGIVGNSWHPRVIDRAVHEAGYSRRLLSPNDDLRVALEHGTFIVDGVQNKMYVRASGPRQD